MGALSADLAQRVKETSALTRILRIGHRGAAGYEPENTLRSFRRALDIGVDFIETDLQLTADGHVVLMHDKRVDRTTNGTGYVREMTLAELRRLDAGKGELIPTLSELLELARGRSGLMLEIIAPGLGAIVPRLVRESGFEGPVIYASFHHPEVLAVRSTDPDAMTLALFEAVPVNRTSLVDDAAATHAGIALDSLTADFVGALHAHGSRVFVYTANDPRDIETLKAMPVDGLISDFPDRI